MTVPARYYWRIAEELLRAGVDVDALLAPLDLSMATLAQPQARLQLEQADRLVQGGVAVTGRQDIGFDLGRVLKLSSHDIVGFGLISSPNVDYALRLLSRFFSLILPVFRMRYRCDAQYLQVTFEAIAPMSRLCLDVHLEALATATHFELGDLLRSRLPDYDLQLSMAEPPHAQRYSELKGARVQFQLEQPARVCLQFPAEVAQRQLDMADASALKMAEARCRTMVQQVVNKRDVTGWVRMMLSEDGQGLPSLGELAHTLNMSIRTLDRHLKREGTGYRTLLREARLTRARHLLRQAVMSTTAIAHELGYSDAANFTRAFRKATGMTPSAFRQTL